MFMTTLMPIANESRSLIGKLQVIDEFLALQSEPVVAYSRSIDIFVGDNAASDKIVGHVALTDAAVL